MGSWQGSYRGCRHTIELPQAAKRIQSLRDALVWDLCEENKAEKPFSESLGNLGQARRSLNVKIHQMLDVPTKNGMTNFERYKGLCIGRFEHLKQRWAALPGGDGLGCTIGTGDELAY